MSKHPSAVHGAFRSRALVAVLVGAFVLVGQVTMLQNTADLEYDGELERAVGDAGGAAVAPALKPVEVNKLGVARSSQFPAYDVYDSSAEANIVFFLQLSESSLALAPRLLKRLWHPRNQFLVHIDAKAGDAAVQRFMADPRARHVHYLPRETITYAGVSMLLNTLAAMEHALWLDAPWDYFINVSGSDYPLVPAANIRRLLGQPRILRQGVSFLQLSPDPAFWARLRKSRFDSQYVDPALGQPPDSRVHTELRRTKLLQPQTQRLGVRFVHAEAWVTAHRTLVVEAARGAYARKLLALLSTTMDPEEHFFAMLAWNTPALNRTLAHHAGRSIFWRLHGVDSGQHPSYVDKSKETDGSYSFWNALVHSRSLFVRKFSEPDSPLMDLIDQKLSGAHNNPDHKAVEERLRNVHRKTMCNADIERHWYNPIVHACFAGGNLAP